MKMNKKGFTLIELLAIIVILAIIALIAVPVVLNIINKAQDAANLRSVEALGSQAQTERIMFMMENGNETEPTETEWATLLTSAKSALSGDDVTCTFESFSNAELKLKDCTVGGGTQKYSYSSKTGAAKQA